MNSTTFGNSPFRGIASKTSNNYESFIRHVKKAIREAQRLRSKFALVFIDIDRFEMINEKLGHKEGYQLIELISQRLHLVVSGCYRVFHLGSDEFAVLFENYVDVNEVNQRTKILLESFRSSFYVNHQEVRFSASIGVSLFPAHHSDAEHLFQQADRAMQQARKRGGNQFEIFNGAIANPQTDKINLELDLHKALENSHLQVYYQPKLDLAANAITELEALVRWHHAKLGWIPPSDFIPIAEEVGLISVLGEYVLSIACFNGFQWLKKGLNIRKISVNMSPQQMHRNDLVGMVSRVLKLTGFPARLLELEITESILMESLDTALENIKQLRQMGITIAIDDFGTGYSSFTLLKKLPIDILKIDRIFIQDLLTNKEDATITKAIIDVAHSLHMKVIAEGAETREQIAYLQALGCDSIQGFYISQPLPPSEVPNILHPSYRASLTI